MSGLVGYKNDPITIVAGADEPNAKEWQFDHFGNITVPPGGDILNSTGNSLLSTDNSVRKTSANVILGSPTVVWSSIDGTVSFAKLLIQAECEITGDLTGTHTQSCEIIVASRSNQTDVAISVYGLTYTSPSALITFTAERNLLTNNIDVLAAETAIVSSEPLLRIYSIEQVSRI